MKRWERFRKNLVPGHHLINVKPICNLLIPMFFSLNNKRKTQRRIYIKMSQEDSEEGMDWDA